MTNVLFINGPLKGDVTGVDDRFRLLENSDGYTHMVEYRDESKFVRYWVAELNHEGTRIRVAAVKTTMDKNGEKVELTMEDIFKRYLESPEFNPEDIKMAEVK
jgi:hypothetical protein